jgi:hypothetical protein
MVEKELQDHMFLLRMKSGIDMHERGISCKICNYFAKHLFKRKVSLF